ncbi:hypothetical protein DK846_08350 [Methanospirillum lacunae]|uniref:Uncharacterized protein n=1 Tax=Methanospirillum lacunae TaxID=668570 RepID=A0A2V2N2P5_9EURY|nr:hypothetical protein DK846_08350 [Methanospirillum lacunae]
MVVISSEFEGLGEIIPRLKGEFVKVSHTHRSLLLYRMSLFVHFLYARKPAVMLLCLLLINVRFDDAEHIRLIIK